MEPDVLIVGGGLAGLSCARRLQEMGISFRILEAADEIGGRVRSDYVDGFTLDRGFQVMLTAYPEAQETLDFDQLDLQPFASGSLIRHSGRFHRFVDPWRNPRHVVSAITAPIGNFWDRYRLARLRSRVSNCPFERIFERPETSTIQRLRDLGFSESMIDRFFRPFMGGVFLDSSLETSSRMFEFVFRMFATGEAALPSGGMGRIPRQIADALPEDSIRTRAPVASVQGGGVLMQSGDRLQAEAVVMACDEPAALRLAGSDETPKGRSVTCLYFAADSPPEQAPMLMLNGEGAGPINNVCVPSQIAPKYAPVGQSLVSVSILGVAGDDVEYPVREQLESWFGSHVRSWRLLSAYRIRYALPIQKKITLGGGRPARDDSVIHCGDFTETGSIQGAMHSGRIAAERVAARLGAAALNA